MPRAPRAARTRHSVTCVDVPLSLFMLNPGCKEPGSMQAATNAPQSGWEGRWTGGNRSWNLTKETSVTVLGETTCQR